MNFKFDVRQYVCLLLLLLSMGARAQTLVPNYGSPTVPLDVANGAADFKIRINGGTGACATSSTLTITLPLGYVYIANSAAVTAGSGNVSQTSVSGNVATLSVSNIPAAPDSTVITYQAYPGCGVIGGTNTNIAYNLNACAGQATANTTVNAQNAQLNITNITNGAYTGGVGSSYLRAITIANNGLGNIDTIYLNSLNTGGIAVTAFTSNIGTIVATANGYRVVVPSGTHLGQGQTVVITETVSISSCLPGSTSYKAWYGPNATECSSVSNSATAGATATTPAQPDVVLSTITIPNLKCLPTGANDGWVVFQAKNTSTSPALFTSLVTNHSNSACHACFPTVGATGSYGGNTCGTRTMYIDTTAGVSYSMNGGATWNVVTYAVHQSWDAWTAGGGYNAGKPISLQFMSGIPQLNGGDSVRVRFKLHDELPPCCIADWYQASVSFGASYTDICGNNPKNSTAASINGNASQRYSMNSTTAIDAVAGSPYYLTYTGFIVNGNTPVRADGTGYIDYEITLPTSLIPSTTLADNTLTKAGASISVLPTSVTFDPLTRKLRIRFLRSALVSIDYTNWSLSVKTTVDCSGTGGTATLNAFAKLSSCAATEFQVLCNREANFVVHGCNPLGCEGPLNYATKAVRTNYGVYSSGNNGVPGGTLNTNNLILSRTVNGDTVAVIATAKIQGTTSFSNIFVGITKSEANTVHPFVDATAYIYNTSGITTVTGITAGTVTGTNPSTRIVSLGSGIGTPATYAPGDSIVIITRFRQLITTDKRVDFTTSTYASNSATFGDASQIACDGNWTGTVYNIGTFVQPGGDPTILMTECSDITGTFNIAYLVNPSAPSSNLHSRFPYEIRKLFDLDTLRLVVPQGFEVTNMKVAVSGQNTAASTGIATLPVLAYNAGTNTYYYNVSTLSETFFGSGNQFSEGFNLAITPTIKAKCKTGNFSGNNNQLNITVRARQVGSSTWAYAGGVFYLGSTNSTFVPLSISSTSANLTVNADSASWVIQINNPTTIVKPNTWIAEATGVNTVGIYSVQELTGANGTVVSTANNVGGIYQLGAMPASTTKYFRVNATFTNCTKDSMKLVADYNCDAYPTSVVAGETGCRLQTLPVNVTAQTAALQLAKIAEPVGSQNLCDNLVYELEVTNSGLGAATDLSVKVQIPFTGGIEYVAGTYGYKYPATAGSFTPLANSNVTILGSVMTFTVPASALASLPGTEKYRIQFQMKTLPCNFSSGEKLVFRPVGKNACGATILGTAVAGNRINIVGVPPLLPQFTISSSVDSVTACGTGAVSTNYKFKIVNTGSLVTSLADGFRITLPAPWTMNTAVTYSHNVSGATYGASPAANVYDFKTGAGLAIGDSIVFTTTLNAAAATGLNCGTSNPIVETGFVEFATFCANPAMSCNTKQLLEPEHTTTSIFVKRPSYTITAFTASASGTPQNHLVGNITIANGNTTYVAQNATLKVYHDVNQNGIQDAGDVLIGNQIFALANLATQSFSYDITATIAGNVCPLVAVMDIACNCSPASFSLVCTSVVLPIKYTKEEAKAEACNVNLEWAYETTGTIVTGFVIERSTATNSKWETMAKLNAYATQYTDRTPTAGLWLYRIEALNTDNEKAYSKVLQVATSCKKEVVQIYPNPAYGQVNVLLQGYGSAEVDYVIMDKLGRHVQTGVLKGDSNNTLSVDNLAPGMYQVHIQYGGINHVQKLDILK